MVIMLAFLAIMLLLLPALVCCTIGGVWLMLGLLSLAVWLLLAVWVAEEAWRVVKNMGDEYA